MPAESEGVHSSVKAIQNMEAACARFARALVERLPDVERELRQVTDTLEDRRSHLRGEIAGLQDRLSSEDEEDDLAWERRRLEEAEEELASVQRRIRRLSEAGATYADQFRKVEHLANSHSIQAREFLNGAADDLKAYLGRQNDGSPQTAISSRSANPIAPQQDGLLLALQTHEGALAARVETEKLIALDAHGNVVLEQAGDESSVIIPSSHYTILKDATVTHNHPRGFSFSSRDLSTAADLDLAEIRAVGVAQPFTYSLKRPLSGWPNNLRERYLAMLRPVKAELTERTFRGELTPKQAAQLEAHEVMTRLAAESNLKYERTER